MSVWDHIYNSNLQTVINSMAADETKEDLCMALEVCGRIDLLEQCLMLPGYRKFAEEEYDIYLFHYFNKKQMELKKSKYPDIFKKWDAILQNWHVIGNFGVNYPSNTTKRLNLDGDYVAIYGDGLFLMHFRIVSIEKEQFSYATADSQESLIFKAYADCKVGDILTGQQIADALEKMYQPPF